MFMFLNVNDYVVDFDLKPFYAWYSSTMHSAFCHRLQSIFVVNSEPLACHPLILQSLVYVSFDLMGSP